MPVVTALRATRRGRVAVYVDGEFVCAVGEAALARRRLHKGLELSEAEVEALAGEASVDLARADAYRLLGHRARSTDEVRRRLLAKEHAAQAVEAALASLTTEGLLDDAAFARSYVADKRRLAGWGEGRIRRGLVAAGVARHDIEVALDEAAEDDAGDAELRRALDVLGRRVPGGAPRDDAARRRAYQLLLRRGFTSGVTYAAVRKWAADAPGAESEPDPEGWDDPSG